MEADILLWIQEYVRNPALTPLMKTITHFGDYGMFWILMTILLLLYQRTRKIGLTVGAALLGSLLINNVILKNLVARTRPYEVIEGLQLLVDKAVDLSFPSGHTGSSFAAAVVMFKLLPKRYGTAAMVLACLIGFSRLYIGIHYPTDVLFGMVSGGLIGFLLVYLNLFGAQKPEV